ncbi:MAG: hypothetical protein ABI239_12355 [Aquihabitans sp.]
MYRSYRLPRRFGQILTAVAALGSMATVGLIAAPAAASPNPDGAEARSTTPTPGACTTAEGVTVVIDFQELGGGSYVRCAPNSPKTGFEALEQAGISYTTTTRSPGFLCRIAGKPADDPCRVPSPTTAYWSYWVAPSSGYWCYSNFGAGNRRPPAGTVEGWSFSLNKTSSATPPPSIAPPKLPAGVEAGSLPKKDCTVPTEGVPSTTTPTTPGPATTRPGATPPSGPSGPAHPGATPGTDDSAGPMDGSVPKSVPSDPSRSTTVDGSTTTAAPGPSTSTTPDPDEAASGDESTKEDGVETSGSRGITDPEKIAALEGRVDLGDDGRSKGSPLPLIVGGIVITGLVAGGVLQRRRTQSSADPT